MASVGFVEEVTSLAAPATASPPRHLTVSLQRLSTSPVYFFDAACSFFTVRNHFGVLRSRGVAGPHVVPLPFCLIVFSLVLLVLST